MPTMLTVNLDRPVVAASVLTASSGRRAAQPADAAVTAELSAQIERYRVLCVTLQNAVARVHQFYDELFAGHSEAIARLSTEIARKVLMRNIADGDYEIEAIVTEVLKNAPGSDDVVIRLNPQDLTDCRVIQQAEGSLISGVELLADPDIGRGECVLESPKGIIKSRIDEHLQRIGRALEKTGSTC